MICRSTVCAALLGMAALLPGMAHADGINTEQYQHRSVSPSRQFTVYCPDTPLRLAISGYVDTAKEAVLSVLGVPDQWKVPIVVTMVRPETTRPGVPLARLALSVTDEGPKIDLVVAMNEEQFREVQFPQWVIRAVLMEIAYRNHFPTTAQEGNPPPDWLVEAIADRMEARHAGKSPNAALFRNLISTGRIPPIHEFLASDVSRMDSTARTIFAECSASLLDMLIALPGGQRSLYRAVRSLRTAGKDPVDLLLEHFPALGKSESELERWWTLGLARYSASDRYLALSVAETDARLAPLLLIEVVTDAKSGEKTSFRLEEYPKFIKLRAARGPLLERVVAISALHTKAHPLMRPVIAEYRRIFGLLAEGKTRGIQKPLDAIGNYRHMIVSRSEQITDYLNWYEATQMPGRSGAFDSYLQAAEEKKRAPARKHGNALTRYVDQVEREFQ